MNNVKMINNWTVYKNSTIFYRKVKTKLTFTQSENVRRTVESMIKLEVIHEAHREIVAKSMTRLILNDYEVSSNLRAIAAGIARTSNDRSRIKNAKRLLSMALNHY